jgi:hypothetical protein
MQRQFRVTKMSDIKLLFQNCSNNLPIISTSWSAVLSFAIDGFRTASAPYSCLVRGSSLFIHAFPIALLFYIDHLKNAPITWQLASNLVRPHSFAVRPHRFFTLQVVCLKLVHLSSSYLQRLRVRAIYQVIALAIGFA